MDLFIKNMISSRCKIIVEFELQRAGLKCISIDQGRVIITGDVVSAQIQQAGVALLKYGLVLMDNKKNILIEKIKQVVTDLIFHSDIPLKTNFSDYLSNKLDRDYTYLANTFSDVQGITIEQFIIMNKIQLVKQLIWQDELSLTEISWKLHYSSVAHLSNQFKKVTGLTPSQFKHFDYREQADRVNV
ncbi:helix-turn-helix domain-containing protein [Mucilaginibacter dorajii]|uniref:HTH araC/xylS-type domain-containing protein n=1 Tax=Mucilaginibacter dorajii TaxID=692994 RepID=A0ABP7QUZ9_9SPHI|nr:helix-turn-helix domain-containing protein [Mucilaginibacter dorajii]MCS3735751.1 AraC-like DNA-binding protein [Mucilaginibacter dorajii]